VWGGKHFYFADNITVGVKNLDQAVSWYRENLGLHRAANHTEEVDELLVLGKDDDTGLGIMLLGPDIGPAAFDRHPILYTKKIEAAHKDFASRGIRLGPIQTDSGGNRFFQFQDLDGNTIEVCVEP
jgi:catechol 2,3-dioxygenase-like lactoylglutathione lyase family enzyme